MKPKSCISKFKWFVEPFANGNCIQSNLCFPDVDPDFLLNWYLEKKILFILQNISVMLILIFNIIYRWNKQIRDRRQISLLILSEFKAS